MIHQHESEMGMTHHDFFRLLPLALKNLSYQINDHTIQFQYAKGHIEINLGRQYERKIASLSLPVVHVQYTFTDIPQADIDQFLTEFMRVYQRGGG